MTHISSGVFAPSLIAVIERPCDLAYPALHDQMDRYFAQAPLFQRLPRAVLKAFVPVCEVRRFRRGETIFQEGQPAESVWVVQQGWVSLIKRTPQGVPVTIFTVTPEDVLCGYSAVVGRDAYYASATAATETTAIRIPRADFARLLKQQPGLAEEVLAIYHTRMRHLAEVITLAQAPVEQRLAYTLLRLRATFGKTVPVTHHELARMAGIRWETSIRTVASFKRKQWLVTARGQMTVLKPKSLKALLASSERRPCL